MNLTQELKQYRANFKATQSEAIKTVMAQATTDLINSKIAEQSIGEGQKLPSFTLPNAVGQEVTLESLLAKGALVVSFYRGGWCPYCNMELRALQAALPEIEARGANLVAISPETPDASLSTTEKNELSFEVLSDAARCAGIRPPVVEDDDLPFGAAGFPSEATQRLTPQSPEGTLAHSRRSRSDASNVLAKQLGLVFALPESLRPIYSNFGVDIPAHNGDDTFELPLPATYVVSTDGTIVYRFADADYTKRLDPTKIIEALDTISASN